MATQSNAIAQPSRRTVNEAKKNIAGIVSRKVGTKWMWSIPNEDCNIAEVSSDEERKPLQKAQTLLHCCLVLSSADGNKSGAQLPL